MKPNILISYGEMSDNYITAVTRCGGNTYIADGFRDTTCDGLILIGGRDIEPSLYGEKADKNISYDKKRDSFEMSLADKFISAGKPVLGICRGCQLLNVYFGGTLYTHLESASFHRSAEGGELVHFVSAEKDSVMEKLYGERFPVNSFHHQAINNPGQNFRVTARCTATSVAEAAEHQSLPVLGVQWHPERMGLYGTTAKNFDGMKTIGFFLWLCKNGNRH